MKKHELIKYAYDNYPKGTKFKNPKTGKVIVSSGNFSSGNFSSRNNIYIYDTVNRDVLYFYTEGKWAEIVPEKKPLMVSDKLIAVKVESELEYIAMRKFCKVNGLFYGNSDWETWKANFLFFNLFNRSVSVSIYACSNHKAVSFAEFAKEHSIRIPLMISEDGVELFEGDDYYCVKNIHNKGWEYCFKNKLKSSHFVITDSEICKAFHSKQAALDWIEKANKSKEIKHPLYFGQEALIINNKSEISIMDGGKKVSTLSFGDINDLYIIVKDLK